MVYTPIEIMALILIVAGSAKILVLLINPKIWSKKVINNIWKNSGLMRVISLILAGISLYYLLDSGITIVQIFAIMLFTALLMAAGIAMYSNEVVKLSEKMLKDRNIIKKSWLYILIWILLIVWAAKELVM